MNLYRPVPSDPHDWFSPEQIAESRRYNLGSQRIALTAGALGIVAFAAVIGTRATGRLIAALDVSNWAVQLALAVVVLACAVQVATLPTDVWKFHHEARWQFTNQTTSEWVADYLRGFALGIVVVGTLVFPLWAVIRWTPLWWLFGWLVFLLFTAVISALYPSLILPIFNKLTPITDERLRERIRRLSREARVPVKEVFSMDASKRTRKDNAFFTGLGPTRRVVLYDNVLKQSPREIDVVLAHEVGHWRRRHVLKSVGVAVALSLSIWLVLKLLSTWRPVLDAIGVEDFADPRALPFVGLVFIVCSSATDLVSAWFRRAWEREADLDSLEFTRDADTFLTAHEGLATRNLSELEPSWWHRIRADHPAPAERLALAKWWRTTRTVTVLFTDIVESTQMVERLGDARWFDVRGDHDDIVRGKVAEHRGTVIDAAGDGFLVTFEDTGEALLCAIDVQIDLADYNVVHPDTGLRVRMGLHTGEVIRREGAVVGRDVHIAARVSAQAQGGEIVVSDAVRRALETAGRFTFENPRDVELKGLTGAHRIYTVRWREALETS